MDAARDSDKKLENRSLDPPFSAEESS